jgi:DNA (cytosine-5)-methyltransferase 1
MPCGGAVRKTVRDSIGNLESPSETKDPLHRVHLKNTPRIKQFISKIPVDGGSRMVLGKNAQLQCHKNFQGFKDVYGRMRWDDVAPTITGGCCNPSKGRFLHPQENRGITLREAALLQTFPKKYYFPHGAGLTRVARLIGDALPPMFAQRQGQHLMKHIAQMVRD